MFDFLRSGKSARRTNRRGSSLPGKTRGRSLYHRRLLGEALEARMLLSIGTSSAAQSLTLTDLPVAEQAAISAAIGRDQAAYHAASAASGVTLANAANGFTAQLQSGALQ